MKILVAEKVKRDNTGQFIKGFKYPKEWAIKRVRPKGLKYKIIAKNKGWFKKGNRPWNEGTKGICKANSGSFRKGEHCSPETEFKKGETTGDKNVKYWRGKKLSEKHKKKISEALKGRESWFKGRTGEKHPKWKGGYENKLHLNRQRYKKKRKVEGSHTLEEWRKLKAQYNWTCPACGRSEPKITLTEDHIVPLSRGGLDDIENIQPLCKSCNSKKHAETKKF